MKNGIRPLFCPRLLEIDGTIGWSKPMVMMQTLVKIWLAVVFGLVLGGAGCAGSAGPATTSDGCAYSRIEGARGPVGVRGKEALPAYMVVRVEATDRRWFGADDFKRIAVKYIQEKGIEFDMRGAEVSVWIDPDKTQGFAEVMFSHGIGGSLLTVDIERGGKVTSHWLGYAID